MFGISLHFTIERWKYNKRYNLYVSTLGRIKHKKVIIEPQINTSGYCVLPHDYAVEGLSSLVHRLVLETFKGKSDLTVDHLNSNKRDNRLCNLEYVSQEENQRRAKIKRAFDNHATEITQAEVQKIIKAQEKQNVSNSMTFLMRNNILTPELTVWLTANKNRFSQPYIEAENEAELVDKVHKVSGVVIDVNQMKTILDKNQNIYGYQFNRKNNKCIARLNLKFIPHLQ